MKISLETHKDMRRSLKRSAAHVVATQGLENTTTKLIAAESGLAEAYIYRYYDGKKDLLEQTFLEIDQQIIQVFQRNAEKLFQITHCMQDSCYLLWKAYWNYLVQDADQTVFHSRFYYSAYYTKQIEEARKRNLTAFQEIILTFDEQYGLTITHEDTWLRIIHMMESTLSYAMRVIRCEYESSEEHVKRIFDTVFPPVMTLICPTPIWNQCLRVQGKDDCLNLHEQDIQNGIIQHCPVLDAR